MPTEGTNTIAGLDVAKPSGSDPVSESDDYHRQIKSVLKNIFAGSGGGFATPITATEAEINYLSGVTQNVNSKFTSLDSDIADRIKKDGTENFATPVGCDTARTANSEYPRSDDWATSTLGGTVMARYDSGSNTLYLTNNGTPP